MSTRVSETSEHAASLAFIATLPALRLIVMALLVLPSTGLAGWSLYEIFAPNGLTGLEIAQLVPGVILFAWLTMAFWTAVIGFVLSVTERDPLSLRSRQHAPASGNKLMARYAVVMPVYNEDTRRIMVGFEACVRELLETEEGRQFDFYMLSDTQDVALADAELKAWQRLTRRLSRHADQLFYRRREVNSERKVGNLKDFCQRFGSHYEAMIVLDADSMMSAERMLDLARRIEQNPDTALIQTIPMPVRQHTVFGRFVQFASRLYSPMLATGLSFWQTDSANYWGHNAIVRIAPFMACCGLPSLPGKGAFGGDILSHDFVEAALLRRAGWQVFLLLDTDGSYEEVPANLVDYAVRDRRWLQGNIQHLGLLMTKGLTLRSRLHFLFGAFAYLSSLLLFVMLLLGTADALVRAVTLPTFFTSEYQLFPDWQVARHDMMQQTLWGTAALLTLPKVLGVILALIKQPEAFGGVATLLKNALLEAIMAMLIAPLMMFYHSYFILSVLVGHKVSWEAQARDGATVPWRVSIRYTQLMSCLAVCWGVTTWYFTPSLFYWLLPVLLPMLLAAPLIRLTSHRLAGAQWMTTDNAVSPCKVIKRVNVAERCFAITREKAKIPALPAERWRPMPVQSLDSMPAEDIALAQHL
ncbi:glucans biosynthesis glucosyltransferase MdoH [Alteromonas sp. CYL-A6]|uniref:glucans biosynthesis glucosyltransferase MdoH n=1 Tax=Alteromonas nitratireducens TaxID=3390813 RepID=UPI0034C509BB